jgi:PST family polysaccharide transporter
MRAKIKVAYQQYGLQIQNFLSLSSLQFFNLLIPFFTLPYLIRTLGQVSYGQSAFVLSLMSFLQMVVDFGFGYTGTRLVVLSKDVKEKSMIFFGIFFIKTVLFLATLIILFLISLFVVKVRMMIGLFYISTGVLVSSIFFPAWFYQGMENMKVVSAFNFIIRITSVILLLFFIKKPQHLERYLIINTVSNLLPAVFSFIYCIYTYKLSFSFPPVSKLKEMFMGSMDLFLSNVIISGYSSVRVFVVGIFSTSELLGIYSILERIYFIIQNFPLISFMQVTYPKLVKTMETDQQKVVLFMRNVTKYAMIYFVVAILTFMACQKFILTNLLHVKLPHDYFILSVLLGVILLSVIYNAFKIEFLLISGNDKLYRVIHFFTGLVGAASLVLLTYKFGVIGCAASTLLTQITIILYTRYVYKKHLGFTI